jgi:formylglycine-generating enzyme required for sulfatase activity
LWRAVTGANPSQFKSPTRPVEQVSFEDVQRFMGQLNDRIPGLEVSLPSEAQWEYACRAAGTATYPGRLQILRENNAPALDRIAWYGGNSGVGFELKDGVKSGDWPEKQYSHEWAGTRQVRLKAPNAAGLYDMLGNVWEWWLDEWHDNYEGAPTDGSAWIGEGSASRVMRGGSWIGAARRVRTAYRYHYVPTYRNFNLGFRCAQIHSDSAAAPGGSDARTQLGGPLSAVRRANAAHSGEEPATPIGRFRRPGRVRYTRNICYRLI